jgi:hypothetical protein
LEDWDQKDHGSRPSQTKISQDSISTNSLVLWYVSDISSVQETEIGRITAVTLNKKKKTKLGMVACACHPSDNRKYKIGESQSNLAKSETLSLK